MIRYQFVVSFVPNDRAEVIKPGDSPTCVRVPIVVIRSLRNIITEVLPQRNGVTFIDNIVIDRIDENR